MVTETEKNKKIKSVQDQILQYMTFKNSNLDIF